MHYTKQHNVQTPCTRPLLISRKDDTALFEMIKKGKEGIGGHILGSTHSAGISRFFRLWFSHQHLRHLSIYFSFWRSFRCFLFDSTLYPQHAQYPQFAWLYILLLHMKDCTCSRGTLAIVHLFPASFGGTFCLVFCLSNDQRARTLLSHISELI